MGKSLLMNHRDRVRTNRCCDINEPHFCGRIVVEQKCLQEFIAFSSLYDTLARADVGHAAPSMNVTSTNDSCVEMLMMMMQAS